MVHSKELIENDIQLYLNEHEQKTQLRLLTCGSVDDGKSTLIGRLLHDSKLIYEDQLSAIKNSKKMHKMVKNLIWRIWWMDYKLSVSKA